jgi:hypothetical protein
VPEADYIVFVAELVEFDAEKQDTKSKEAE